MFKELARCQIAGSLNSFYEKYSFELWVNAVYEVGEIVRIYNGLSSTSSLDLTLRLQDAVKGKELYVLDSANRSGRDFTFELSIAAKFSNAGLIVDFGHDADLRVLINGLEFFVECKRLKSEKKIQKRIKEGLKQLHKRYVKSEKPKQANGMLALSIGKTINKNLGVLEGVSPNNVGLKAFAYNQAFIEKYRTYWQSIRDKRTVGVAVVLDAPGIIKEKSQLTTIHEVTMNNSTPINTREYQVMLRMADLVFNNRT